MIYKDGKAQSRFTLPFNLLNLQALSYHFKLITKETKGNSFKKNQKAQFSPEASTRHPALDH